MAQELPCMELAENRSDRRSCTKLGQKNPCANLILLSFCLANWGKGSYYLTSMKEHLCPARKTPGFLVIKFWNILHWTIVCSSCICFRKTTINKTCSQLTIDNPFDENPNIWINFNDLLSLSNVNKKDVVVARVQTPISKQIWMMSVDLLVIALLNNILIHISQRDYWNI